jgi:hypothetical protein
MAEALRVHVEPARVELTPGGDPAAISVHVYNATRIVDEFVVSVIGTGQWMEAEGGRIRLFPDTDGSVDVRVSIPKGRVVAAGQRVIGIQATSVGNPTVSGVERVQVDVAQVVAGEGLSIEPKVVRGGSSGELIATVRNGGNVPLVLTFVGEDPEREVAFAFEPAAVTVPPGGQAWSRVQVSANPPMTGEDRNRQIVVRAEGGHTPLVQSGTFVQHPSLSRFRLYLLRVVLTLTGAALMVAGALAKWKGSFVGTKLTLVAFADTALNAKVKPPKQGTIGAFLISTGFVVIVLGVIAALGILTRRARLTKIGAGLALLFLIAFVALMGSKAFPAVLGPGGGSSSLGVGVWISLLGSLIALVAGFLGTTKKR